MDSTASLAVLHVHTNIYSFLFSPVCFPLTEKLKKGKLKHTSLSHAKIINGFPGGPLEPTSKWGYRHGSRAQLQIISEEQSLGMFNSYQDSSYLTCIVVFTWSQKTSSYTLNRVRHKTQVLKIFGRKKNPTVSYFLFTHLVSALTPVSWLTSCSLWLIKKSWLWGSESTVPSIWIQRGLHGTLGRFLFLYKACVVQSLIHPAKRGERIWLKWWFLIFVLLQRKVQLLIRQEKRNTSVAYSNSLEHNLHVIICL